MKTQKIIMENTIISISAIFVACVAVGISIWQGFETRRHNKLSVKPYLVIRTSTSKSGLSMGVWVENDGLGPALIKDFIVYFDGQPTRIDNREAAEKVYRPAQIYEKGIKFWSPMKSTVLKRDGRTDVISYPKAIWTPEGIEMFAERLSHLHFKFIYESIYGEKFETNTLEKQQETPTLS